MEDARRARNRGGIDLELAKMQSETANATVRTSPVSCTRTVQTLGSPSIGIPAIVGLPVGDVIPNHALGYIDHGLATKLMTAEPVTVCPFATPISQRGHKLSDTAKTSEEETDEDAPPKHSSIEEAAFNSVKTEGCNRRA